MNTMPLSPGSVQVIMNIPQAKLKMIIQVVNVKCRTLNN